MASALLLLLLAPDAAYWADALSSADPGLRRLAAEELHRLGERGAEELERREIRDPEARRHAHSLLRSIRRPTLALDCLPDLALGEAAVEVDVVIGNPAPWPIELLPIGSGAWSVLVPQGLGSPEWPGGATDQFIRIGPRSSATLALRLPCVEPRAGRLAVGVAYHHEPTVLEATAVVTAGGDGFARLRAGALSRDPERRESALRAIRARLRRQDESLVFTAALAAAIRSPNRDFREGVARALAEEAGPHARLLLDLAGDADPGVAEAALAGIGRRFDLAAAPRALHRLAARHLVARDRRRRAAVDAMLRSAGPAARRRFLADVLAASRAPPVHEAVARVLAREGMQVPVDPASGLVPRSAIASLYSSLPSR